MRWILGIDTASRVGSIALADDGTAVAWEILPPGMHSSVLAEAAGRLLQGRGLSLADLAGIAVSSGPGSFTGLRIGLAWAKGCCFVGPARLALVSSHEANAHRHRRAGERIGTVLPGDRGEVQLAIWECGPRVTRAWGPERLSEDDLPETLRDAASGHGTVLVAAPDLKQGIREMLEEEVFTLLAEPESRAEDAAPVIPPTTPPTAASVAELGDRALLEGRAVDPASAAPSYGRAPNARRPAG